MDGRGLDTLQGISHAQSLPLGGRTVRGTVRSGPGEATINHRCPSAHTGADEGATLYPTFPCRKGDDGCRLNELRFPPRWASRSPPHQSPSVTASPQGEAFVGATLPPRNSFSPNPHPAKCESKSGHVHGPRNSPTTIPLRPTTPKRVSGNEWAIKKGGPGGKAPGALSSGFLRRKPGSRPESGGNPRRRSGPATVPTEPLPEDRPPPSPGEFPRPQAGKESAIMI